MGGRGRGWSWPWWWWWCWQINISHIDNGSCWNLCAQKRRSSLMCCHQMVFGKHQLSNHRPPLQYQLGRCGWGAGGEAAQGRCSISVESDEVGSSISCSVEAGWVGLPVGSPLHLKRVAIIMCNCAWHMKIATSTINAYNLHHHLHADQVRWQWQSKDFHRQFQITINHPCHYRIVMLWRFCVEKEGWEVSSWENEAEEVVHYCYYFYCYYYDYYTIQCLSLIWRIQVGMGVRERVFFVG